MIKLGVSACFMYPDPSRLTFGHKTLAYFEQDMSRYLARDGVMPILIPDLDWGKLEPFLKEMDGFVFQGGVDVAPKTYGDSLIENGRWPGDAYRDQYELKIMDWAFKNKKPIFTICRGMQLANVYFGGTLYQDLFTEIKTSIEHRNAETYDHVHHSVTCPNGSLIASIYGQNQFIVNSVHHQGVKKLGTDLSVDAISPIDQVIEAFHYAGTECKNGAFLLGVQWHPEFSHTLKDKVISPEPLLDFFLTEVSKHKK